MTSTSNLPWVDPGAFEVAPHVFRVPLPLPNDGLRAVNVYVIVTDVGLVCIDAGWAIPDSKALLGEALASLGFTLADITRFLITHVHRDHYTQAVDVRRDVGSRIGLGRGEKAIDDRSRIPPRSRSYRLFGNVLDTSNACRSRRHPAQPPVSRCAGTR